jgi:hypothetical protein
VLYTTGAFFMCGVGLRLTVGVLCARYLIPLFLSLVVGLNLLDFVSF